MESGPRGQRSECRRGAVDVAHRMRMERGGEERIRGGRQCLGGTAECGLPEVQMVGINQRQQTSGSSGGESRGAEQKRSDSHTSGAVGSRRAGRLPRLRAPRQLRSANYVVQGCRSWRRSLSGGRGCGSCRRAAGSSKWPPHILGRPAGKGGCQASCVLGLLGRPPGCGGRLRGPEDGRRSCGS